LRWTEKVRQQMGFVKRLEILAVLDFSMAGVVV
jgi:hypothetical protein